MGNTVYNDVSYRSFSNTVSTKTRDEIFEQRTISKLMSPLGLTKRECRDGTEHPNTYAIAVFLDETGSMGKIPENMVREGLGTIMTSVIKGGLKDAQIMFGFIGDHYSDNAPVQIGQFENGDKELTNWLTQGYLEANGGGQAKESYLLAWKIAAEHTDIDCMAKRKKKGLLVTIGDEATHRTLEASAQTGLFGNTNAKDISAADLLSKARESYEVYHIHANDGNYPDHKGILGDWRDLIGSNLIVAKSKDIPDIIANLALQHGLDNSVSQPEEFEEV